MSKKLTFEEILNRFKKTHGDIYDYSESKYTKINESIKITCRTHGAFSQTPDNHFRGQGCPSCSILKYKTTNIERYGHESPCSNKLIQEKIKNTNIKKYGCGSPLGNKSVKEKSKKTMLDRYGVEYSLSNKEIYTKVKKTNLEKYGTESSLGNKEVQEKTKKTNLDRYGCESPLGNKEVQEKSKQTMLERHGVEFAMQNKEVQDKVKKTNIERYGTETPTQNKDVYDKVKKTNLERYGVENPLQNKDVYDKVKKTNLERYGAENPLQNKDVQEKSKQTMLERHGVEFAFQNEKIKEKIKKTNLEKYGVGNPAQKHITKHSKDILSNHNILFDMYKNEKNTTTEIGNVLGVSYTTINKYLKNHNIDINYSYSISSHEKQLQQFLLDSDIKFNSSNRIEIAPKELDAYIPKHNLAIEINGVYWHSLDFNADVSNNRKKHLSKTEACVENGIELLQFTDIEWINKQEIVKSMILNKCGLTTNKVFARKCILSFPTKQEERVFFDANHLQGFSNSSICYGLKHNDNFVCMISFRQPRYNKEFDYEIIRIASKLNTTVIGGISKLFKHFLKNNQDKTVITYADRRYSTGNIYKQLGFEFSHHSNIGYNWCKNNILYNRVQFQKHKLKDKLKDFDELLSESQNMFNNGYRKLYDCGQSVFII